MTRGNSPYTTRRPNYWPSSWPVAIALLGLALCLLPLRRCINPEPPPVRGLYTGDPGALFDSLHFLPNNRVQIALHAHTQQCRFTVQGNTLQLDSDRTTEELRILADGTIDGGPILGTYRLASTPASE